jgi:hypothetical protein
MAKEIEFKDRVSPEKAADYKCESNGFRMRESKLMASLCAWQMSLMVRIPGAFWSALFLI